MPAGGLDASISPKFQVQPSDGTLIRIADSTKNALPLGNCARCSVICHRNCNPVAARGLYADRSLVLLCDEYVESRARTYPKPKVFFQRCESQPFCYGHVSLGDTPDSTGRDKEGIVLGPKSSRISRHQDVPMIVKQETETTERLIVNLFRLRE